MIDDDPAKARERVLAGLHRIYGAMPGIDVVPVSGTVDDVVAGLRQVIDAGAEMILLNPVGSVTWQRIASRWNALPQR